MLKVTQPVNGGPGVHICERHFWRPDLTGLCRAPQSCGVWLPAPRFLRRCQQLNPGRGRPQGRGHLGQPPPAVTGAGCHLDSRLEEQPAYDSRSSSNSSPGALRPGLHPVKPWGNSMWVWPQAGPPPSSSPRPQPSERRRPDHSPRVPGGRSTWPKRIILES